MSVVNGQDADQNTFNNAFISKTDADGNEVTGNIELVSVFLYFGRQDVDGSYRIGTSGSDLVVQKRISSTWTTVGAFSE